MRSTKKAQMQMSVGTIVTIVLLMTVLILGLTLTRTIFRGSIENINSIDQAVKSEINKLFAEDDNRKVVVYPPSKLVVIQKGNEDYLGFAFSIRNLATTIETYDYEITADGNSDCGVSSSEALSWIKAGKEGTVTISASSLMEDPEFVRFIIPDDAPPCLIRYSIEVDRDGRGYTSDVSLDLEVKSA